MNWPSYIAVAFKERPISAAKAEKAPVSSKAKDKGGKGKGGKGEKDKGSRPPSQQFDITKPNWTLRVVSDGIAAVCIASLEFRTLDMYNFIVCTCNKAAHFL